MSTIVKEFIVLKMAYMICCLLFLAACTNSDDADGEFSCSTTEDASFDISGTDLTGDFSVNDVAYSSTITETNCSSEQVGNDYSSTYINVMRDGNSLYFTTEEDQEFEASINGNKISITSMSVDQNGCTITLSGSGELDINEDEIDLDVTITLAGDDCRDIQLQNKRMDLKPLYKYFD